MPDDFPRDRLEKDIARERAALSDSLSGLARATDLRQNGDDAMSQLAQKATRAARDNPAGLALLGLGLAVLAMPSRKREPDTYDARTPGAEHRMRLQGVRTSGNDLRARLDRGLEKLGPEARARVKAARLKAVEAQDQIEEQAARLGTAAAETHDRQPLLTAAIAAGIGGLVGALLPTTRHEDRLMGDYRDAALRDAEAVLRAELAELTRAGADELSNRLDPTSKSDEAAAPQPEVNAGHHG